MIADLVALDRPLSRDPPQQGGRKCTAGGNPAMVTYHNDFNANSRSAPAIRPAGRFPIIRRLA
jgi:hypothetical protein